MYKEKITDFSLVFRPPFHDIKEQLLREHIYDRNQSTFMTY